MLLEPLPGSTGSARKIGNAGALEIMKAPDMPVGMPMDAVAILRNVNASGFHIMFGKNNMFLSILSIGMDARWS